MLVRGLGHSPSRGRKADGSQTETFLFSFVNVRAFV